ncbi:hypothetical protein IHQ71_31300 (plasmid) [Rhizobium sp. TH2]|uniref:hypothetical protein n=1 Tax=Rhizobium sp. TH2 TaxID=2775403 RepID=UPI0021584039|nr:hypothetical protein [Rhizobium sp. TH2]UVC12653.1 hypothetical protein IHQ71_31300 [Rhizobium sp. TH2]
MARDWRSIIRDQGELARIKIKVATTLLADPDVNLETISRLHRDVEEKAKQFDVIFLEMSNELDLEHPLVDAALSVERLWSGMSVSVANRVSKMAGTAPIELRDDGGM